MNEAECVAAVCVGLDRPCSVSSEAKTQHNTEEKTQEVVGGKATQTLDADQEHSHSSCSCGVRIELSDICCLGEMDWKRFFYEETKVMENVNVAEAQLAESNEAGLSCGFTSTGSTGTRPAGSTSAPPARTGG